MANKVIISILVFLVVLSGGLGAYVYILNQQVEALGVQLGIFQEEQSVQIRAVSDELAGLKRQTLTRINSLEDEIGATQTQIGSLQDEISGTSSQISLLEDEIKGVSGELSELGLNADELYQKAGPAIVRIGDGEKLYGSGFIFDTGGHVVTAYHVIEQLSKVYVTLADGRSSTATIAGSCEASDVAVLTLSDKRPSVEPLTLADSAQVRIGEPVVAIGHPFDLTGTLTSGIVSQKDRFVKIASNSEERWIANLIQYDAAVNPGNSGGPLLNARGEVIGLVIARVDPGKGEGIYYAISSNKVKRVAAQLIDQGFFDYPWIGIEVTNLTPKMIEERALETNNGVLVKKIFPGSAAEGSDIKVDDVIVAIDSVAVNNIGDLTSYLGEHKSPDDLASLTFFRHAVKLDVSLEVGKRPS